MQIQKEWEVSETSGITEMIYNSLKGGIEWKTVFTLA